MQPECRACRAYRATSPFSLPRAYLFGRPEVCCGVYCCPFVRVSCRSPNSTSPTRTTCFGQVAIPVASSSDTDTLDFLVTFATRMLLQGNCSRGSSAIRETVAVDILRSLTPLSHRRQAAKARLIIKSKPFARGRLLSSDCRIPKHLAVDWAHSMGP